MYALTFLAFMPRMIYGEVDLSVGTEYNSSSGAEQGRGGVHDR